MPAIKPEWFVALLGAYVVWTLFHGVLNRMSREVPQPLRCAIALFIVPGVLGKAFGIFMDTPEVYVDLLLLGGLALLFTVDRRHTGEPASRGRILARTGCVAFLVFAGLASSAAVHAQTATESEVRAQRVSQCVAFSQWVQGAADMRDAGASLELHLPIVEKRNAALPPAMVAFLVRETRRVHAKAVMSADELEADAFERCLLGLLGK